MTKECLSDTLRNIIRLTDYEKKRYRGIASYKMLAKALRLYVLQIEKYGYSEIKNINNYQYENYFIDPFWLAIHLDRACQRSETVAIEYIKLLIQKGQMPQQIETIEDATEFLLDKMYDSTNFYFRYAPEKQFGIEEDLLKDSKISKLDKLPKFQSHHKPQK